MEANELLEPFERMLAELFPPARVRAIEAGDLGTAEWAAIEQSGFLDALVAEDAGGAGLMLADVLPLFMALGRHAVPVPIGETMLDRAGHPDALPLLRAAQIAGAGARVLAMSVAYANERAQFGKPIGRQQAVQQQLAVMAQDVVATRLAVQLAAARGWPSPESMAAAKSVASAAARIANTAHAVHGAIGISAEFDLQLYTRRLHQWRLDHGAETLWNRRLGAAILGSDATALDWIRANLF